MAGMEEPTESAGTLQTGTPIFEKGIFSCDMIFATKGGVPISNAHMASAAKVVAETFKTLLLMNGFYKHGEPRTDLREIVNRPDLMAVMVSCPAEQGFGSPEIIRTGEAAFRKPANRATRRANDAGTKKLH